MLLSFFNPKTLGDVLLIVLSDDVKSQDSTTKGNVTRIFDTETNKTIGFNIRNVQKELDISKEGQIFLNENQVDTLNDILDRNGFESELIVDNEPKFVVGHVDEISEHPDSDHLHITQVNVGKEKKLQIVCGAPNVDKGQNVVVALEGAVMPDGKIIWPGKLRGVESYGMISSARELALPNAPKERGILVLNEDEIPGTEFKLNV